jgi:hypothetical protein
MSKVIEATCVGGVVTAEAVPVEDAVILSEGEGSSEGILVMQDDKQYYLAKTSEDLKATLDEVITALNQLVTVITAIGAGMTGPTTAPPPTLATDLLTITNAATTLQTLKGMLK